MKKIFLLSTFIVLTAVAFAQTSDVSRQGDSIVQIAPAGFSSGEFKRISPGGLPLTQASLWVGAA